MRRSKHHAVPLDANVVEVVVVPLLIAEQPGHADPGFTLKRYGHLFKTIRPTLVEWPEDLLWPAGSVDAIRRVDAAVGRQNLP